MEIPGKKPTTPQGRFQKPLKPAPVSKGPFEKRGGIPRKEFPQFFKKGPYSIPWSKGRSKEQLGKMGEKILKERFPSYYGRDINAGEIQKEIDRIKRTAPKTRVEGNELQEKIVRLEEAKRRAGL